MKQKFKVGDIVVFIKDGNSDCRYANYGGTPASRPRAGNVGIILHMNVPCVRTEGEFDNIIYLDEAFEESQGCHPVYSNFVPLSKIVCLASETERAVWESRKIVNQYDNSYVEHR